MASIKVTLDSHQDMMNDFSFIQNRYPPIRNRKEASTTSISLLEAKLENSDARLRFKQAFELMLPPIQN